MLSAADITLIQATIASSLDQSLPLSRKSSTKTSDASGHDTTPLVLIGNVSCTISKPTASHLQLYAGIIGSQRALMLRAMQTTDIREGDNVAYAGLNWLVHGVENAESYSWANDYLLVTVIV